MNVAEDSIASWIQWINHASSSFVNISRSKLPDFRPSAWTYWDQRLRQRQEYVDAPLAAIICDLKEIGPGHFVMLEVHYTTIQMWSRALVAALTDDLKQSDPPAWMGLVALDRLGFDEESVRAAGEIMLRVNADLPSVEMGGRVPSTQVFSPGVVLTPKKKPEQARFTPPQLITATWMPSAIPMLLLEYDSAPIIGSVGLNVLKCLGLDYLVIEIGDVPPAATSESGPAEASTTVDSRIPSDFQGRDWLKVFAIAETRPKMILLNSVDPQYFPPNGIEC